jgi:hypothetical protein
LVDSRIDSALGFLRKSYQLIKSFEASSSDRDSEAQRCKDVVLPTRNGITLRKRCIGQPNQHQLVLLQHLGWKLPSIPEIAPV